MKYYRGCVFLQKMNEILDYYREIEINTAHLAQEAIELQEEIDEDETTLDTSKVTWANLRTDEDMCKIICGFTVEEFLDIYTLVEDAIEENIGRGRRSKITKKDKLVMVLCHLKHYEILDRMKITFCISKAYLYKILNETIIAITPVLYDYYVVHLEDRLEKENEDEIEEFPEAKYVMDATFQEIWTPMGSFQERKQYFSGKHKMYGLKSQCIHDRKGRLVHCIPGERGALHDFTICRNNIEILRDILRKEQNVDDSNEDEPWCVITDLGYIGLQNLVSAIMPHKKKKNKKLTKNQKRFNRKVASQRVICERFYGRLKTKFRIMSIIYRNSRDEYKITFQLCSALTNFDIILHPL